MNDAAKVAIFLVIAKKGSKKLGNAWENMSIFLYLCTHYST